ncbi:hypothetical protein EV714DRAFT_221514, partial [Schizophyllum commune]
RMMKNWTSPIYVFFHAVPEIEQPEYIPLRALLVVSSSNLNKGCSKRIRRYLDTGDKVSTSNMTRHAITCWGKRAVDVAQSYETATAAQESVTTPMKKDGDIKLSFECKGKGKITYTTRPHTKTEINFRPFAVVEDDGFKRLMKTGQPDHYIPSCSTVSRDVKRVFVKTRTRIARMLQEYESDLSFQTDCWTSPNHKAYMGTTVTFKHNGSMLTLVLDVVEVAKVRRQLNKADLHSLLS